jgi:ATP-dependent RNA helicase DeaD
LNPGGLLRLVCDATGLNSNSVGRIDIMTSYSFFEADNEYAENIVRKVNGSNYEGHDVSVEITKDKPSGGGSRDRRDGGSFGGKFKGSRDSGGYKGSRDGNKEGGYRGSRDGNKEGGFRSSRDGNKEGGYRGSKDSREGGFKPRSEDSSRRDDGKRRESSATGRPRTFGKPFNKKS